MNITNNKGIVISRSCERVNSQRRTYHSNHYYNAFIKDAIELLEKGRTVTCFFLYQVEELKKVFKDLIVSYDTNMYILRRI